MFGVGSYSRRKVRGRRYQNALSVVDTRTPVQKNDLKEAPDIFSYLNNNKRELNAQSRKSPDTILTEAISSVNTNNASSVKLATSVAKYYNLKLAAKEPEWEFVMKKVEDDALNRINDSDPNEGFAQALDLLRSEIDAGNMQYGNAKRSSGERFEALAVAISKSVDVHVEEQLGIVPFKPSLADIVIKVDPVGELFGTKGNIHDSNATLQMVARQPQSQQAAAVFQDPEKPKLMHNLFSTYDAVFEEVMKDMYGGSGQGWKVAGYATTDVFFELLHQYFPSPDQMRLIFQQKYDGFDELFKTVVKYNPSYEPILQKFMDDWDRITTEEGGLIDKLEQNPTLNWMPKQVVANMKNIGNNVLQNALELGEARDLARASTGNIMLQNPQLLQSLAYEVEKPDSAIGRVIVEEITDYVPSYKGKQLNAAVIQEFLPQAPVIYGAIVEDITNLPQSETTLNANAMISRSYEAPGAQRLISENQALTKRVKSLEVRISSLEEQLIEQERVHQEEFFNYKLQLDQDIKAWKDNVISHYRERLGQLQTHVKEFLSQGKDFLDRREAEFNAERAGLQNKVATLESNLQEIHATLNRERNIQVNNRTIIDELESQKVTQQRVLDELEQKKQQLIKANALITSKYDTLAEEKTALEQRLDTGGLQLQGYVTANQSLLSRLGKLESDKSDAEARLENANRDISAKQSKINELNAKISETYKHGWNFEVKASEATEKVKELVQQLETVASAKASLQTNFEEFKRVAESTNEGLRLNDKRKQEEIESLYVANQNLNNELLSERKSSSANVATIDKLQTQIATNESYINSLKNDMKREREDSQRLILDKKKEFEDAIRLLNVDNARLTDAMSKMQRERSDEESRLNGSISKLQQQLQTAQSLQQQCQTINGATVCKGLEDDVRREIDAARAQLQELKDAKIDISNLKTRLKEQEALVTEYKNKPPRRETITKYERVEVPGPTKTEIIYKEKYSGHYDNIFKTLKEENTKLRNELNECRLSKGITSADNMAEADIDCGPCDKIYAHKRKSIEDKKALKAAKCPTNKRKKTSKKGCSQNSHAKIIRKISANQSLLTKAKLSSQNGNNLDALTTLFPDSGAEVNEITSEVARKLGLIKYGSCKMGSKGSVCGNESSISEGHTVSLSNNFTYGTWKVKLHFVLTPGPKDNIQIITDPGQDGIVSQDLEFYFPKIYIPTSSWDVLIGGEGASDLQIQMDYSNKKQNCLTCGGKGKMQNYCGRKSQNCLVCGGMGLMLL